jgi:hypothetical protein
MWQLRYVYGILLPLGWQEGQKVAARWPRSKGVLWE